MAKKGKLTEKQQRFVDEYLIDLNATQAAIRAGYSVKTADAIGCENLTKPNIQQAIAEHMAERSRRTGVNQDRVVLELAKIAFVRMTDVVDSNGRIKQDASADDLSCIESIKYKESDNEFGGSVEREVNNNDDFIDELSETLTDCQTKGFAYMYAMKDSTDKLKFTCADSIGVVEVEARFAEDGKDHVIYWYVDRVDKEGHRIKKIMDWDDEQVVYYVQTDEGEIQLDDKAKVNPRPHILYQVDGDDNTYIDSLGFLPFFRLDNNKKQISNLKAVKDLIDDYDLMASSLSNNLIDFDHPLYAVKGFEGDNLDELQQNLKTKKIVGVGSDGGIEVHTVDVPYEARKVKLELDEKNIWNEMALRIAKGMNSPFRKAYNNAIRIARTEGHRIQNEATLDGQHEAKKKGADIVKQWDATLDSRTRPEHREADGQIMELDEPFDVGGEKMQAPGVGGSAKNVCNCRCCLLQRAKWALDDDELKTLQERAAFFGLDKTQSFNDFKQKGE